MPKTVTKIQMARLSKLQADEQACRTAVYSFGPNRDTRFSDCLDLAPAWAQQNYKSAYTSRVNFERSLVAQGRAWFTSTGMFQPY